VSLVNTYAASLIVMNGRQRKVTNAQTQGNYEKLELLWQLLHVTSVPFRDLDIVRPLVFFDRMYL
jgi:hypothetical protein